MSMFFEQTQYIPHKFPYKWTLKDAVFTKDKGTVFSCFSCGGGSTMGYKLAGFDVIGCNEIDPKMMACYIENHKPKYSFLESIQTFKNRIDLPDELYNLDILDGSPPCSSFSMAGSREDGWGKEKKFREGQKKQVLDTLFFDFIELGKKLQPKIIIAENVKGLLLGGAYKYYKKIHSELFSAGYYTTAALLDASKMGVPQKRERVFIISIRKDIAIKLGLDVVPKLDLKFNECEIPFTEIADNTDLTIKDNTEVSKYYDLVQFGQSFSTKHSKGHFFGDYKADPKEPLNTICADPNHGAWHPLIKRMINFNETILASSYAMDYNFTTNNPKYLCGMSVPPVMTAQIASRIYEQWLSKI